MGLLNDIENVGKAVVHGVEEVVMAPAEIAHWALGKMFGDADGELQKIAAELSEMGKQIDELSKEISSTLSHLTWHGPASDAFVNHANGRVKELVGVADELEGLSGADKRLASIY